MTSEPDHHFRGAPAPQVSVVVPSYGRPIRLRWLLNGLEGQTLDPGRFEVIVGHAATDADTVALVREHALAGCGVLRGAPHPERAGPAVLRNLGWRRARAPFVVFTDDDCRPQPDWLERALAGARAEPGAIVQGRTLPDRREKKLYYAAAPWSRTQWINPPSPWAETCNIGYPREMLERLGGFDERFPAPAGEDTDLAQRALEAGGRMVGVHEMVMWHAVHTPSPPSFLRSLWRFQQTPDLVARHPGLRDHLPLRFFWKRTHLWLVVAAVGAASARHRPSAAVLALPYLINALPHHGGGPRGRVRSMLELPSCVAIDLVEIAAMARGSIRARTFLL